MTAVKASFHTTCPQCDDRIVPGDRIVLVDDEWVHEGCEDTANGTHRVRPRREEVCTSCFLIKPCPCDDGQGDAA